MDLVRDGEEEVPRVTPGFQLEKLGGEAACPDEEDGGGRLGGWGRRPNRHHWKLQGAFRA